MTFIPLLLICALSTSTPRIHAQPPTSTSSSSPSNPFLSDPSMFQLPRWSTDHPLGAQRRTTDGDGNPLPSNTASLALSNSRDQGPLLFDPVLANKHASFNRQRIPERVVHARGHGAFGNFVVIRDATSITKAKVFNKVGKITPIFVRFSSTNGEKGGSETLPDPRGFAIKFYTEDGNLDFPGLQIDAFTLRDAMLFPDLQTVVKRNPATHLRDETGHHDFLSQRPEIIHQYVKSFADSVRLGSARGMNGSAVNVYECVNSLGVAVYCKFSWTTWQNIPPLTDAETLTLAGTQPDYYTKDLYNAIALGEYPKWTFGVQVLTFEEAETLYFNPFDATKVWRYDEIPFIPIGVFVLDTNPTDFFSQVEQAAFCPNFVPGIRSSPDRILQARAFAYKDAQRYRLGANFELIEVNRPQSPVAGYERDGNLMISALLNGDGGPVYFPNSFNGPRLDPDAVAGAIPSFAFNGFQSNSRWSIGRLDSGGEDNFSQPRRFLEEDVGAEERGRIATRIATALSSVIPTIRTRVLTNCIYPLGQEFGDAVVQALTALGQ